MGASSPLQVREGAEFALEQINSWINNIDGKVSNALAFSGILIGFILVRGTPQAFTELTAMEGIGFVSFLKAALVVSLYVVSLVAICFFLYAILCRVTVPSGIKSHLFFGSIQDITYQEYCKEFMALTEDAYITELLEQIHTNSTICSKKAAYYNQGIKALFVAVILCFVCFVFHLI